MSEPRIVSGHDCRISDLRVEIKFSTLWETGVFKFQQIREQTYDTVALLGVAPLEVSLWFMPKGSVVATGQHDRTPFVGPLVMRVELSQVLHPAA